MNKISWILALLGAGLVMLSSCSEQKDGFITISSFPLNFR